jgi:hypothetical protein
LSFLTRDASAKPSGEKPPKRTAVLLDEHAAPAARQTSFFYNMNHTLFQKSFIVLLATGFPTQSVNFFHFLFSVFSESTLLWLH